MLKDRQRKEREQERETELGEMKEELEEDWKEFRRERKLAKLTNKKGTTQESSIFSVS